MKENGYKSKSKSKINRKPKKRINNGSFFRNYQLDGLGFVDWTPSPGYFYYRKHPSESGSMVLYYKAEKKQELWGTIQAELFVVSKKDGKRTKVANHELSKLSNNSIFFKPNKPINRQDIESFEVELRLSWDEDSVKLIFPVQKLHCIDHFCKSSVG